MIMIMIIIMIMIMIIIVIMILSALPFSLMVPRSIYKLRAVRSELQTTAGQRPVKNRFCPVKSLDGRTICPVV